MNQLRMKVIVLGEKAVGKTHFLNALRHENASSMYLPTIGVDMFVYMKGGTEVHIWDSSGAHRFRPVVRTFLRDVSICIVLYKDKRSLDSIEQTIDDIEMCNTRPYRICIVCVSQDPTLVEHGRVYANMKNTWFFHCNLFNRVNAIHTWHRIIDMCEDEVHEKTFTVDKRIPVKVIEAPRTFWEKMCIWR